MDGATLGSGVLSSAPDFLGIAGEAVGYTLAEAGDVDGSGDVGLLAGAPYDGGAGVA